MGCVVDHLELVAPGNRFDLFDARSPRDDTGPGSDPLAEVVPSGSGTDADAGEYLND